MSVSLFRCFEVGGRFLRPKAAALATVAACLAAPSLSGAFECSVTKCVAGYSGSSALSNVPVLVRIYAEQSAQCRADGADICFTSVDGSVVYPHEIDVWRPTGESLVWVKLPSVEQGTEFKMWWRDATANALKSDPSPSGPLDRF